MGIFRHLSKSLKSTLIPKSKIPIYVCEIPVFFSLWIPKVRVASYFRAEG